MKKETRICHHVHLIVEILRNLLDYHYFGHYDVCQSKDRCFAENNTEQYAFPMPPEISYFPSFVSHPVL